MGIRETLNKRPALVTGVTVGVVVVALIAILWQSRTRVISPTPGRIDPRDDPRTDRYNARPSDPVKR